MNRCSSYSGGAGGVNCSNLVGPCSCGLFHTHQTPNSNSANSFPMLFSSFDPHGYNYQGSDFCPFPSPSSSSSSAVVDCTLSLGTPSTRMSSSSLATHRDQMKPSSYVSNFCWDILHPKPSSTHHKNGRGNNSTSTTNSGGSGGGGDALVARRCANCDTTSTPLWRNGPRGPKSLCNACGIRFKKEERRANAAASTNGGSGGGGAQGMVMESQHMINSTSWVHHSQTPQKPPSCYSSAAAIGSEFRFIDDVDDLDSPFLSWRLNVTDRPGLVHDFH